MTDRPLTPAEREDFAELFRKQYWVRALLAAEHELPMGPILRSATGILPGLTTARVLVTYGPKCVLLDDDAEECSALPWKKDGSGVVWTNVLRPGSVEPAHPEPICTVKRLVQHMQALVDRLQLTHDEADRLAALIVGWIGSDNRSLPGVSTVDDRIPEA